VLLVEVTTRSYWGLVKTKKIKRFVLEAKWWPDLESNQGHKDFQFSPLSIRRLAFGKNTENSMGYPF
jgi:hypothetical protein